MSNSNDKIKKIYDYIESFTAQNNYPPSVREICLAINLKSPSSVQYYLDKMVEQGLITKRGDKKRSLRPVASKTAPFLSVPLVGTITAGTPIFAVENLEGYYPIPVEFSTDSDLFLLKVKGTSMKDAGIFNGDKLIVKKQNYANNGDIIVAYFDDCATVKRFFLEDNKIILHPENAEYSDIILDNVDILGVVQGLYRKF